MGSYVRQNLIHRLATVATAAVGAFIFGLALEANTAFSWTWGANDTANS
jgi:hypothetical protein